MSEEIKIKEKREEFESLVQSWNGTEMWFQERMQQFPGIVEITTDDWGVKITINSEYYRKFSCLLYTSPSPRDRSLSRMPSSA